VLQVCQLFLEKGSLPFQLCCQQGGFPPFAQKFAKGEVKCGEFCKVGTKGSCSVLVVFCGLDIQATEKAERFWEQAHLSHYLCN
jgi:hypothetical protein